MKKWILILVSVLGTIVVAHVVLECLTGTLPGELSRLRAKGEAMVTQIEAFKRDNGHYPATLAQVGVTRTKTRFGPWDYQASTNSFTLSVGDYNHCFILGYRSDYGWWKDQ